MKHNFTVLDAFYLLLLSLLSLFLVIHLLGSHQYLDTNYADWMYHAFRVESLQRYGLTSWDHTWYGGVSYWRAYQFIPHMVAAALSWMLSISASQAMIMLSIVYMLGIRWSCYIVLRLLGGHPTWTFFLSVVSFSIVSTWRVIGDFSLMIGVLLVPWLTLLWMKTLTGSNYPIRILWACIIGIGFYIHPLVSVFSGILWLIDIITIRRLRPFKYIIQELLCILGGGFFYLYQLIFVDTSYTDWYQLTPEFKQLFTELYLGDQVLLIGIAIITFGVIVSNRAITYQYKILHFIAWILFVGLLIDAQIFWFFTTKIQFIRSAPLIWIFLLISCVSLGYAISWNRFQKTFFILIVIGSLSFSNAIRYTAIIPLTPTPQKPDIVTEYRKDSPNIEGKIAIVDLTFWSYYSNPDLQFVGGYNNHLLPNLLGNRLLDLISRKSPYIPTPEDKLNIRVYSQVLGVSRVFLEEESPYLDLFMSDEESFFRLDQDVSLKGDTYYIFEPSWPVYQGVALSKKDAEKIQNLNFDIQKIDYRADYTSLDRVVAEIAKIKYQNTDHSVEVEYPKPNQMTVFRDDITAGLPYIYLSETYSRGWTASKGTIMKAGNDQIIVNADDPEIILRHTWGWPLIVQGILWSLMIFWLGLIWMRPTRNLIDKT